REFFEPFRRTLEQTESAAGECVRQAVRDQLAGLARRTRPYLEQLGPLVADPEARRRVEDFDCHEKEQGRRGTGKGQLNILSWAADPTGKEVGERFLGTYVTNQQTPIAAEACFPLAGAEPNQTPQKFPWARAGDLAGGNHQVLVLRLRDALADGMRRRVLQLVSQLNKQGLEGLKDQVTAWDGGAVRVSGKRPRGAR